MSLTDASRIISSLKGDIEANSPGLRQGWTARQVLRFITNDLPTLRFASVLMLRVEQLVGLWVPPAASLLKQLNQMITGADISWKATIGPGLILRHPSGVVMSDGAVIGSRLVVQQGVTIGGGSPRIGEQCHLGAGCRVLGDIRLHDYTTVAANAVVVKDAPEFALLVGVPATVRSTDREAALGRLADIA